MFINQNGKVRVNTEAIAERIKMLPDEEIEALEDRKGILRDVLNALDARLKALPQREQNATLSLLYKEIIDKIYDFHLSLETSKAREQIASTKDVMEKRKVLRQFQAVTEDLAMLYRFK